MLSFCRHFYSCQPAIAPRNTNNHKSFAFDIIKNTTFVREQRILNLRYPLAAYPPRRLYVYSPLVQNSISSKVREFQFTTKKKLPNKIRSTLTHTQTHFCTHNTPRPTGADSKKTNQQKKNSLNRIRKIHTTHPISTPHMTHTHTYAYKHTIQLVKCKSNLRRSSYWTT